ncbi:hypothetical protein BTVI_92451 [Pitangus sulphuratus]|nr:hypothetical protein BTVI_92451 [Pitangus sulphuratus]
MAACPWGHPAALLGLLRLFLISILIEDSEDYWYPGAYNPVQIQADVQTAKLTSSLFRPLTSLALSHRDDDIEIESVVGFAEAQDEEQAEQTRSWQAPVEPGKLCKAEQRSNLNYQTCSVFKVTKTWIDGRFEGNCCLLIKILTALD